MPDLIHEIRSRPKFLLLPLNIPTHPTHGSEAMLGRRLRLGRGPALSDDENMLINLLQGRPIAPIVHQCSDAVACAFCSAVRSMQILMDMELGRTEQKRAA